MNAQNWFESLVFPIIIIVAYLFLLSDVNASSMALTHIAVIACGIVPLILTIVHKADLSKRWKDRTKYIAISAICVPITIISPSIGILACIFFLTKEIYYLDGEFLPFNHTLIISLSNPIFVLVCLLADGINGFSLYGWGAHFG